MNDSSMVALLPTTTGWCKQDLPHTTLVYSGEVIDRKISDFNAMAKDAMLIAMAYVPITLKVYRLETFGPEDDRVDVLKLVPTPDLIAMRKILEPWDVSEFSFNPHATIGPVGSASKILPKFLTFDRIIVAFGDNDLTFKLIGQP